MAKLESILGKVTGSIGNMTFRHKNGLNSTISAKANEVKNPKTVAQATQRMKIRPSQLFYSAFENVLNHSRQGLKIGDDHRKAFMSEVLKNSFAGVPYIVKGTNYWVPGRYPMSKGNIQSLRYQFLKVNDGPANYTLCLPVSEEAGWARTCEQMLGYNPQLQEGDEICFVWAEILPGGKGFTPRTAYFILDPNDDWTDGRYDDILALENGIIHVVSENCVAGCVIVSRKSGDNYKYSNEFMILRDDFAIEAYSAERYQAAVNSYMEDDANAINSPYILQQPTQQIYTNQIRVFDASYRKDNADVLVSYMASVRVPVNGNAGSATIIGVFTDNGSSNGGIIDEYGEIVMNGENKVKPSDIGWVGQTPQWKPNYIQQVVR